MAANMILGGTYELTIDAKNRLSIPFGVRRKLDDATTGHSFYVMPGRSPGTLSLYPEKVFERMREHVPVDDELSDETYAWRQFEYSQTMLLDPDGQGRILLPDRLLKSAGLANDVTLIAVRDHLELWRRDAFEKFESTMWQDYPQRRSKAAGELEARAQAAAARARKDVAIVQVGGVAPA